MASSEDLSSAEVDALLNEFETKLKRLKTLYEQHFVGVERTPPTTARKEVVRLMRRLEGLSIRNTAAKFRLRSLVQRFNSYKSYWNRVERQIEEGTYHRDLKRAKRRSARHEQREQRGGDEIDDGILEIDLEDIEDLAAVQAELEEMDQAGAFEKYVPTQKVKNIGSRGDGAGDRSGSGQPDAAERERIKQQRLQEIQAQLGLSGAKPGGEEVQERRSKLQDLKQRFEERTGKTVRPGARDDAPAEPREERPSTSTNEIRGAGTKKLRQLSAMKQKLQREKREKERTIQRGSGSGSHSAPQSGSSGSRRVVSRSGQSASGSGNDSSGDSRKVYDKLLEAKRRCNESTNGLTYETVSRSMKQQKEQLRKKRGARDVEFKVVIKDGRAFLKPVPK